ECSGQIRSDLTHLATRQGDRHAGGAVACAAARDADPRTRLLVDGAVDVSATAESQIGAGVTLVADEDVAVHDGPAAADREQHLAAERRARVDASCSEADREPGCCGEEDQD